MSGTPSGTVGSIQSNFSLPSGLSFLSGPKEKAPEGAGGGSSTSVTETLTVMVSEAESASATVTVRVCAGMDS